MSFNLFALIGTERHREGLPVYVSWPLVTLFFARQYPPLPRKHTRIRTRQHRNTSWSITVVKWDQKATKKRNNSDAEARRLPIKLAYVTVATNRVLSGSSSSVTIIHLSTVAFAVAVLLFSLRRVARPPLHRSLSFLLLTNACTHTLVRMRTDKH